MPPASAVLYTSAGLRVTTSEPILRDVPCPLCGGHRVSEVLTDAGPIRIEAAALVACTSADHGRFGRIVACDACGLRFRSPREDDATILSCYGEVEDEVYAANERARVLTFRRALRRLETNVPVRGPLLDVGCYTGVFLDVAAAAGWPVTGLEPSRWAAARAAERGHRVHRGTLETAPIDHDAFAVVTMWDVLEHFTDPVRELRLARDVARSDGYLVLSTMTIDSLLVRALRSRWPWYMRMHLSYFTPATLKTALGAAGWRLVKIHGYAHVVTLEYLAHKLDAYAPVVSRAARKAVRALGSAERTVTISLGDFMTAYAVKARP